MLRKRKLRGKSLKTLLRITIILIVFIASFYLFMGEENDPINEDIQVKIQKETIEMDIMSLIGESEQSILSIYGKPDRIDPSYYDYEWWIYNKDLDHYIQIGIFNEKVVTIYVIGKNVDISPFYIGQPVQELFSKMSPKPTISIDYKGNSFQFELSEQDLNTRPLFEMNGNYLQVYIDQFTGKVSSIRLLDKEALIKQRPYELIYRGQLISSKPISDKEKRQVEEGQEKQIFDITNIIRKRHGLNPLNWHDQTSKVAYDHSKDMKENEYFSHVSPTNGTLANRLEEGGILFTVAGENIAAQYVDGIEAVEGWLNSKGHRKTLLQKDYTHLGIGVFDKYYTQNFIALWEQAS